MQSYPQPETPEQRWQPSQQATTVIEPETMRPGSTKTTPKRRTAPHKRLTGKQKEFIRLMIENPATPLYEVARQAGYNGDYDTLRSIASENLTKPNILHELELYDNTAQEVLTEVMMYSKELGKRGTQAGASYASTARQTAEGILDRLHGKAKQVTETTKRSVTLSIDLTGVVNTSDLTGVENT